MAEPRRYPFDWRPAEHAAVVALLVRQRSAHGLLLLIRWLIYGVLLMGALLAVCTALQGEWHSLYSLLPLLIVVSLLLHFFPQLTGRLQAWQLRRSDPNSAHPLIHRLDLQGVHIETHTSNIELKWSGLYQVCETADWFLFYYSSRLAYYLPKRVVGDATEVAALRDWFVQQLPEGVPYTTA